MPKTLSNGAARRALGVMLGLLFVLPALAGCIAIKQEDLPGVKTACPGTGTPPPQVDPVTHPYTKARDHNEDRIPPQTSAIRFSVLLPPGATTDVERGIDHAVDELRSVGADVEVDKRRVSSRDGVTVREALNATLRDFKPGLVVSALGNDATNELVWLARDRQVALLAAVADSDRITALQNTGGYFFRMPWTDATEGRAAAELLWASGCRSANVIVTPDARSTDIAHAFRTAFREKGGEVARVVTLQEDAANAAAAAERVMLLQSGDKDFAPRPDAVLVIAPPTDAATVLKEAYRLKVSAHSAFFFTEASLDDAFVTAAGKDPNGHLLSGGLRGTSAMAAETRATQAFERGYRVATGFDATNASARGYDAAYLAVLAGACARDTHPDSVKQFLARVNDKDRGDTDVSGADPLFAITTATARCAVNYVGASGDFDWDRHGDPVTGRYYFWTVSGDGMMRVTHSRVQPPPASAGSS